jgi:DHA1 family inner membrane transport protein
LVTGYALSVAFGSPFLAIATARMDRRRALLLLVGIFILGNLLCALAPSYALLMTARIVTALCHGAFFGLGAVVAATLVPREKKGQAIAMMFAGLTLANVLGVPFGTALGEAFGWRDTFWAVVVIGFAAAFALYTWLPRNISMPRMQLIHEARSLSSTRDSGHADQRAVVGQPLRCLHLHHSDSGERDPNPAARRHADAASVWRGAHGR